MRRVGSFEFAAEIERNQAEVYEMRELVKQQEAETQAMMMAFANLNTHPIDQEIFVNTDISSQGNQTFIYISKKINIYN